MSYFGTKKTLLIGLKGEGLPKGGTAGQVLKKKSATDYDYEWGEGGGGTGVEVIEIDVSSATSGTLTDAQAEILAKPSTVIKAMLTNDTLSERAILHQVGNDYDNDQGTTSGFTYGAVINGVEHRVTIAPPDPDAEEPSETYTWSYTSETIGGGGTGVEVVQETGDSTAKVMSQDAITKELDKIWAAINYVAPTIAEMSSTPRASAYKLPATFALVSITHRETNAKNISGKLTLKRGSTVILSDIEPSETSVTIPVTDSVQLSASSITYTLSGKTVKGETISKNISISGYYSSYIGASASTAVSDELFAELTEIESASLSGTRNVNFANAPKYVWFISTRAISSIKSGGFDVPYTLVNGAYQHNGGSYKCYRTEEQVTTTENSFVIS